MKKIQKSVVLSGLVALTLTLCASSASAWWGGYYGGGLVGAIFGGPWCGPCCAPACGFCGPCCTPCCDPCFTCCDPCVSCAPCVEPCAAPCVEPCAAPCAAPCVEPCAAPCAAPCALCGPTYATGYVLGWRPGPIRRLLFGRYRWYPVGYGYAGYGWSSFYGASCGCGASGEVITNEAPAEAPANAPAPAEKAAPVDEKAPSVVAPAPADSVNVQPVFHRVGYMNNTEARPKEAVPENSAILKIAVPMDAVVFVNDQKTSTAGTYRSFVSFGLTEGNEYDYVVRVEVVRNGLKYVESQTVTLTAGELKSVTFPFDSLNQTPLAM